MQNCVERIKNKYDSTQLLNFAEEFLGDEAVKNYREVVKIYRDSSGALDPSMNTISPGGLGSQSGTTRTHAMNVLYQS